VGEISIGDMSVGDMSLGHISVDDIPEGCQTAGLDQHQVVPVDEFLLQQITQGALDVTRR
jgi:hypothetical protein